MSKKPIIKTAMVMAAGHGTRMRPLTNDRSKAMVEVAGLPLIEHMLLRLESAGIERVIVNVHAHADHLEAYLKSRTSRFELLISDERDMLLETGGGIVKARPFLGDDPILICNIDAVWIEFAPVIDQLLSAWDGEAMDELFLLTPSQTKGGKILGLDSAGDFDRDGAGRINYRTNPTADYVYCGVQIFKPQLANGFKEEKFSRKLIWNETIKNGRAFGHVMSGFWMHVGDPDARGQAEAVIRLAQGLGHSGSV
ncbi:MAG: nucleotidyltransferase family protein [Maricaulaceae bacterium]